MGQSAGYTGVGNEFQNLGPATDKVFEVLMSWKVWLLSGDSGL